jgi:glycosyltransferase involved in cell wall biosynthesis
MAGTPSVSIAITVYNCERYITGAVASALAQDFENFEVIIVDDGSTDQTGSHLDRVSDERARVLHSGRIGRGRALNVALAHARAPLVAILDADDLSFPDRLKVQMEFMSHRPEIMLAGSRYRILIDADGKRTGHHDVLPLDWEAILDDLRTGRPCPFFHSSVIFRKSAVLGAGGYNEAIPRYYDVDLYVRLARQYRMANIDAPLSLKRVHSGQYFQSRERLPEDAAALSTIRTAAAELWDRPISARMSGSAPRNDNHRHCERNEAIPFKR